MIDTPHFAPCQITLAFADGEYLFRLGLRQIAELQEKCGAGIGAVFARVLQGRIMLKNGRTVGLPTHAGYRHEDVRETIRLGLVGGGLKPIEANRLVERYVDTRPVKEAWEFAAAILAACIEGYHEPAGEEAREPGEPKAPEPDGSTSGQPSEAGSSWDADQKRPAA